MASKSSDGESKDGSSSDLKLMETYTGKSEILNSEDSGESEKNSTEDGEEEYDEEDEWEESESDCGEEEFLRNREYTEPKWGYDSSEDDSSDKECEKEFSQQDFFGTEDNLPRFVFSGVSTIRDLDEEIGNGLTSRHFCESLIGLCLERYNEDEELNVKLDHIIRVNYDPSAMTKFYITFAAKVSESYDDPLEEYQAKAAWSVKKKSYPIFCRPAPKKSIALDR